ncbi:MAG: hypothetical protein GY803_26900 [Chloroflexi bacterium]|nr:hypothetical protein [Chloroflexota bacterium]
MSPNNPMSKLSTGKAAIPFRQKLGSFMTYRVGIFLVLLLLALVLSPVQVNSGGGSIPTFSIQSVAADQTVTILTSNFPAGQMFAVTMGAMGTLGIDGYLVASTDSGKGGSFTATYKIPEQLKGSYQIAIRLQSVQGYYGYNWFYNNTTGAANSGSTGSAGATTDYTGIPTFSVQSVDVDKTVTVKTNNFPANQTFTVTMGSSGTRGIGGVVVGKIESGKGGVLTATFDIPDKFKGVAIISIRAQTTHANPYYAYNWFYNNTTTAEPADTSEDTSDDKPTGTAASHTGIPTIHMCSVERDKSVMFRANNFPPNQAFTVRMGAMWTVGIGGVVAGSFNSGDGDSFEQTVNIPASLAGSYRISIRAETTHADPYYAYNWFYNNTASVCN